MFDSNVSDNNFYSVYNDLTHVENISSSMCAESSLNLKLTTKGFRIGHINIQGIQNKFDQIGLMLNNSKNDIHIFGLSETKLKHYHPDNYFFVDKYQFFRKDRILSKERCEEGGGIIVYVRNEVKFERRCDIEMKEIECLV